MKNYTAVIERDEAEGVWEAELVEEPRVHTYGRTLDSARANIAEAAAVWFDVDEVPLRYRIEIGADVGFVEAAREARLVEEHARLEATQATRHAVTMLTKNGYSRRDVATLLEISHQRVQQILHEIR
jgi:predicted RNase H-like HicB family nuclease